MFSRKQVMQFRHLDVNESLANSLAMINAPGSNPQWESSNSA